MKKQSSASRSNSSSRKSALSQDVVALILKDHKPIKELLAILKDGKATKAKKEPAFLEFAQVLSAHAKAEEESLYVHLKQEDELRVEGIEGDTEHALAEQLIEEVKASKGDDDVWMAKVKVLAELVDHHVKEEEKSVLKEVRQEFASEKRAEIGELYSRLLSKYQSESSAENRNSKTYSSLHESRSEL